MTRRKLIISLILIFVVLLLGLVVLPVYQMERQKMLDEYEFARSGVDEKALRILQRIAGALEVYCRDNHAFPYDPRGEEQALQKVRACSLSGPEFVNADGSRMESEEPPWEVRVEYLNPPPDFKLNAHTIILAIRPALGKDGMTFFLTDLGGIYQCQDRQVRHWGIERLAGKAADTLPRLDAALIDDANIP